MADWFHSVAQPEGQWSDSQPWSLSPLRPTGQSGSDSDYKTCSHVSIRRGRISSAQPVIVMAAAAGRGDTGLIIGFLRSGHTGEGRHTQRTVSLYQTESMQAGLFTPVTVCIFFYLELGQERFHFLRFQFVSHPKTSSAM